MHRQIVASIAFDEGCAKGKFVAEVFSEAFAYIEGIISRF
jgi:hypothetical protein